MRHPTIRSALVVALLASTGCSLLPTMEESEIQARRRSAPAPQQAAPSPDNQVSTSKTSKTSKASQTKALPDSPAPRPAKAAPDANGTLGFTVDQINKVTYYGKDGMKGDGYLGIGTNVAQLNAMLNISVTDSSNVQFSQVNKVNILHDDDEHPEGGNAEISDVFLIFGSAVEQINLLSNVTVNNASNIRVDQVNTVSLVDSSGHGSTGYLVFPDAGLSEQINLIEATVTNSDNVRFKQLNSIFIIDADDYKDLHRPNKKERFREIQDQTRKLQESSKSQDRFSER